MQTWEAITSRRNVRAFDGRPVPAADLDQILEAGRPAAGPGAQSRAAAAGRDRAPGALVTAAGRRQPLSARELGELGAGGGGVGVTGAQDAGAVGDHLPVELLGLGAAALAGGQPG